LDMLPLFSHLDAPRVAARVDDPRIKSRPTLHYRLPNCEIDREGWDLGGDWARWLQVEHLAADPTRLDSLCQRFSSHLDTGEKLFSDNRFTIDPSRDLTRL
ncbi:MAG: amidoligase family protein, partial [Pseudomonadales bacterium]|nr:amidoligase family protein [Pseudomonadales bacterium]